MIVLVNSVASHQPAISPHVPAYVGAPRGSKPTLIIGGGGAPPTHGMTTWRSRGWYADKIIPTRRLFSLPKLNSNLPEGSQEKSQLRRVIWRSYAQSCSQFTFGGNSVIICRQHDGNVTNIAGIRAAFNVYSVGCPSY